MASGAKARRLGYASEYDYRAHDYGRIPPDRPGLTGEARQQALGKRGASAFASAIAGAGTSHVFVRGKYSEQVVALVTDRRGRVREFVIQREPPTSTRDAERRRREVESYIDAMDDAGVDYDVSVSV